VKKVTAGTEDEVPGQGEVSSPPQFWQAALLEVLTHDLLLRRLDEIPAAEAHARIIQEAWEAQALACRTLFPLLVFPCLFEERVCVASEQHRQQERLYWRTRIPAFP
jgi:hypothetical protein